MARLKARFSNCPDELPGWAIWMGAVWGLFGRAVSMGCLDGLSGGGGAVWMGCLDGLSG